MNGMGQCFEAGMNQQASQSARHLRFRDVADATSEPLPWNERPLDHRLRRMDAEDIAEFLEVSLKEAKAIKRDL